MGPAKALKIKHIETGDRAFGQGTTHLGDWVALRDETTHMYRQSAACLPQGTLYCEQDIRERDGVEDLVTMPINAHQTLSLRIAPGLGALVLIQTGDTVEHALLRHRAELQSMPIRLTYTWNSETRVAHLNLETVGTQCLASIQAPCIAPVEPSCLAPLFHQAPRVHSACYGLSSAIEPVGQTASIAPDTLIETSDGLVPIKRIKPGARVLTEEGPVRVIANLRQHVPTLAARRPVRLLAPYFGLRQDIRVLPDQRLSLSGTDVEYAHGRPEVLASARYFANGTHGIAETIAPVEIFHQLLLPKPVAIHASGTKLSSLNISRIRRHKSQLYAHLCRGIDPALLPEHAPPACPILQRHEVVALLQSRAA